MSLYQPYNPLQNYPGAGQQPPQPNTPNIGTMYNQAGNPGHFNPGYQTGPQARQNAAMGVAAGPMPLGAAGSAATSASTLAGPVGWTPQGRAAAQGLGGMLSGGAKHLGGELSKGWKSAMYGPEQKGPDPIEAFTPETVSGSLNTKYLDQLRGLASPGGQQRWLGGRLEQEQLRQQADRGALDRMGASNMATQQGNMAMRGGLTSGATERMGQQNLMGQIMGQQNLSSQAAGREAGLRSEADTRQRQLLGQLGQSEMGAANYQTGIDQYNANQQNAAMASAQAAQAMQNQNYGAPGQPGSQGGLMGMLNGGGGGGLMGAAGTLLKPLDPMGLSGKLMGGGGGGGGMLGGIL